MSSSNTSGAGGVDLTTLLVTAGASAGAAFVMSKVWSPGTLVSAAFTPVLVALLKEMLARPADVVTRAVPVRGVVRSASGAEHDPIVGGEPELPEPEPSEHGVDRVAQHGELPGRSRAHGPRTWQAAVLTGLLGFLVAAVIITVPELVAGSSASGGGRDTTFFGGHTKSSKRQSTTTPTTTTQTQTETTPLDETVTIAPPTTVTVPPAETTTVPPAATTTVPPAGTTPPAATTPAPGTTVPAEPPPPG
ncbi:MAG TPA: hypothetical protein VHZ75_05650 [Solirubrobacteraceae bacterium]|nr:hypothetical protein [Solirubrobacteraceae bacterium]